MDIITSTRTKLLQQFFPLFTAPGAEVFSRLTIGWILCTTRRAVTGILPFADPWTKRAHDAYRRAIAPKEWSDPDRIGLSDDQRGSPMAWQSTIRQPKTGSQQMYGVMNRTPVGMAKLTILID